MCIQFKSLFVRNKIRFQPFKKIFKLLDTDEDNKISGFNVNVENLPITIQKILTFVWF